ncbi:uncharacterized protein SPAPADRAFT_65205 [Spathaspora passalidarum NRRL Y-27907]|uniref:Cell wall protein n=1 Tax=Spathaspora passalidarum (strain NRRL Y-27907 / 11-Y1) TaxID=619300 RepID=G3AJW5_SPAPN|nr:uncharacterized protein SPAPADRAFT_65205 [Spathaspora passalidarum NRRL Y-27907]EGW34016.1 hypothetical protein SPAPADRAFT_65205 [Spathaspora passalidarum NRRL Y-27907]
MRFLPVLLVSFAALTSAANSTSTDDSVTDFNYQEFLNGLTKCDFDCYGVAVELAGCLPKGEEGESSTTSSDLQDTTDKGMKKMYKCLCEQDDDFFDKYSKCAKNCPIFSEIIDDDEKDAKKMKQFYCEGATATSELAKTSSSLDGLKSTTASATDTSEEQSNSTSDSTETKENGTGVFGVSLISLLAIALL